MTEVIRKSENGEIGGKCVFLGTNEGAGCAKALRARAGFSDFARAGMRKGGRAYI